MNIKNTLVNIASKYKLKSIGIFGSRARGDHENYSDLDVFIIGNCSIDEELKMEEEISKELNLQVDVIRLNKEMDKILLKNIFNEAILIYNENEAFEDLYEYIEKFFVENHDFIRLRKRDLIGK